MANFTRRMHGLVSHITDPEVLAAIIESNDYHINGYLKVQPANANAIIKHGKSPAAEAIAPVASDEKLIEKFSRDNRKGVRASFLRNPNITQDQIEEVFRRSLKNDSDLEVLAQAARRLETDRLLPYIKDNIRQKFDRRIGVSNTRQFSGFRFIGKNGAVAPDNHLMIEVLCERIGPEGTEYVQKLTDIDFDDFAYVDGRRRQDHWYEAGMLEWMAPVIKPKLVPILLESLLINGKPLTDGDVNAAADLIRELDDEDVHIHEFHGRVTSPMSPEAVRVLYDLGPTWHSLVRVSNYLPEDLQAVFVKDMPTDDLRGFEAPTNVPHEFKVWRVDPDVELSDHAREFNSWQSPEVVNEVAERHIGHLLLNSSQEYGRMTSMVQAGTTIADFIYAVHPDRRKFLKPLTLLLGSWGRSSTYYAGNSAYYALQGAPLTDWANGLLEDQPSVEKVAELVSFATEMQHGVTDLLDALSEAQRVSLLLGKPLELAGTAAFRSYQTVYQVFRHYFGDNTDAWRLALQLAEDWDDGLEDLATTVCAANDLSVPETVVDLADILAEEADPEVQEDEEVNAAESESESTTESEDDTTAAEAEDTDEAQEPAAEESDSEDAEDSTQEEADQDDVEEDVIPLDITTPVAYTLF